MEEELYDEFGNYIGPEVNDSDDQNSTVSLFCEFKGLMSSKRKKRRIGIWTKMRRVGNLKSVVPYEIEADEEPKATNEHTYENAVTLYEDKKYYPDAEDVCFL
jgi:U5 small nuclear ribonucleoprotein component